MPETQGTDPRVGIVKPSLVYPGASGPSKSARQMQVASWNDKSVEDDAGSTDVVWNAEHGSDNRHRQDINISDSSMISSLFLSFATELRREDHVDLVLGHGNGNPRLATSSEDSRASFMLSGVLKEALSPVVGHGYAEPTSNNVNEHGEGFKCARYGANPTEEERRAERNRKGRERSMRTRRRNAAHLKMLEDGCTRLIMENRLLRDLLNCLQRVPHAEEKIISLLRNLLSNSRLSSAFRPAVELLEGFAVPSRQNTSLKYHKMSTNVGEGQCAFGEVQQTCTLPENSTRLGSIGNKNKGNMSATVWEPEQTSESVPESSNVSKTSMTTRKSLETRIGGRHEDQFRASVDEGIETREEDRSVLANFSIDEIDAVIAL